MTEDANDTDRRKDDAMNKKLVALVGLSLLLPLAAQAKDDPWKVPPGFAARTAVARWRT